MAAYIRTCDLISNYKTPERKLWGMLLLMAIRDGASAIHYHPWRVDGPLSYVVNNVRQVLVPPPDHIAESLIAVARSLIVPRRGILARLLAAQPDVVCGSLILCLDGVEEKFEVEWDVVCWSSGQRAGVDCYRVDLSGDELPVSPSSESDTDACRQ